MIAELIIAILSSGLIATLLTLKATRRKASAEAKTVEIDNAQKLLDNFDSYIVEPLKQEVNEVRNNLKNLQLAIAEVANCPLRDSCPVADRLDQLHHDKENDNGEKLPTPADPDPI